MAKVQPLKLISKRLKPPSQLGFSGTLPVKSQRPVKKHWLWPTVYGDGRIKKAYKPTLKALAELYNGQEPLKRLREALLVHNIDGAEALWVSAFDNALTKKVAALDSWRDLAVLSPNGSYGPPILKNVLEAITDLAQRSPDDIERLVTPSSRSVDIYIIPALIDMISRHNAELAVRILAKPGWDKDVHRFSVASLLYSAGMAPQVVMSVCAKISLPAGFQLQPDLERRLSTHTSDIACVDALEGMIDAGIDLSSPVMDKILRRVFSYSDRGADMVLTKSVKGIYPITLYPFVIRQLSKRVTTGNAQALELLNQIFDEVLPKLAEFEPSLVLHLVVMRVIATDGVQATAPILDRWVASDPEGVSEPTWCLLFQAFRRMGRPDKCADVLSRALVHSPRLSFAFVGEYLAYVAQFYNIHVFLRSLRKVIPAISQTLVSLGIRDYERQLPQSNESRLEPLLTTLTPKNRDFPVKHIHESWLAITYQAVLATVDEDEELALRLYKRYMNYTFFSKTPTSLRVVDQFVKAFIPMQANGLNLAEYVFRDALKRLHIKRPVDGSNNSSSLEALCYHLVKSNQFERAAQLVNDAYSHDRMVVRASALKPLIDAAPSHVKGRLVQWAEKIGARM